MKKWFALLLFFTMIATHSEAAKKKGGDEKVFPEGVTETKLVSTSPKTLDDMMSAASLVIRGSVISVAPLHDDFSIGSRRVYNARNEFAAKIRILDVYKGGFPEEEITVVFMRASSVETPPLMDVEEGEDSVFFLVPGNNPPYFAPVNYHNWKEDATSENERLLSSKSEDASEEPAKITVNISLKKEGIGKEAAVYATILIMNNTPKSQRVDSTLDPIKTLNVSGADGKEIHALSNIASTASEMIVLKPQRFVGARYDLSKYFDLSKPGAYNVRAAIIEPNWKAGENPEMITSKTVAFMID